MKITRSFRIGFAMAVAAGALAAADDLPKGEVLLDKYVEVTGGKAAYSKVHSEIRTGSMEFKAMGLKGTLTTYAVEPDKVYSEIELGGVGKIQDGSNGEVAWSMSAMQGPRLKEGDEKAEAMLQAKFNSDLKWRDVFTSAETTGMETVDGKECYKVVLKPKSGSPVTKWFDKDSNLLIKLSFTAKSPMGEIQTDTIFSDYRKEGDILLAHKVLLRASTVEIATTVDKVQFNTEIPKEKFEAPDEVKALMKKQ